MRRIWVVLCVWGFFAFRCTAADGSPGENRFRSDTNLVLVPATVVDNTDRFVTDLEASNFRLFDGKDEQKIVSFALEEGPVSVGIVFDASGSMKRAQRFAIDAVREFLLSSGRNDEYSVVQVRDRPELTLDFTDDPDRVADQLAAAPPIGSTALIDSVYLAATHMKRASHRRRMLLVISDGDDNNSRYSMKELTGMLEEASIKVYSIGVSVRRQAFFEAGPSAVQILTRMAESTGGRYFEAAYPDDLAEIMRKIDIRYEYVLGFAPPAGSADGRYHRLQVKVSGPGRLKAFWRPGYYAPQMDARRNAESARRQGLLRPDVTVGDAEPRE